jgi:hypothetical protein
VIVEIEVEDVGIVRPLNVWQIHRAKRKRGGPNERIAWAAESACMSIKQFKSLPAEKQGEVETAYRYLTSAANTAERGPDRRVTLEALVRQTRCKALL